MRSAATFFALMATGVLIVMIYIWSGESIAALIMAIITLFAVLAIAQWRPWAIEGNAGPAPSVTGRTGRADRTGRRHDDRRSPSVGSRHGKGGRDPSDHDEEVWRGRFDITWDRRGVSGVALGRRAPQLWSWSQIDDISLAWCEDERPDPTRDDPDDRKQRSDGRTDPADAGAMGPADEDGTADEIGGSSRRLGLCLDFPSLRNPEEPARAEVLFGTNQDPDELIRDLRLAWRDFKVPRSRLFDLTAEERTRKLVEHFGRRSDRTRNSPPIDLTTSSASPELLYQEIRRALLAGGELCRLSRDAGFDEVLDGFDALLEANGADPLTRAEANELAEADGAGRVAGADGAGRVAALHRTLDSVAEQRGYRVAFIDHGGDDYLLGLIPANAADDWDGQTIGSGSARIVLDLPG